jgi:hypothetical protein
MKMLLDYNMIYTRWWWNAKEGTKRKRRNPTPNIYKDRQDGQDKSEDRNLRIAESPDIRIAALRAW